MANMVSTLMEKPVAYMTAQVPSSATGTTSSRDDRVAEILQEDEHHHEDEGDGLDQRVDDLLDRGRDEGAGIVGNGIFDA